VAAIAEGVTPTNLTEVAVGYVDVPLAQRGALATVTDLVQAIDLINTVKLYVDTMGRDAALDLDTVCRNALVAGILNSDATYKYGPTATITGYFERFAGVVPTGVSANDFASLSAAAIANAKMTRARHLAVLTQLKAARVPTIGGKYVAVMPDQVMHDVRQDTDWVTAATRVNGGQALYKNADIELDGAIFVPQDNAFVEDETYGTYDDVDNDGDGLIYNCLYLGADSFGVPQLTNNKAGGSPMGPKLIVLAQPDKADPLNLKTSIGLKTYYGAKPFITNVAGEVPHYVNFRCKSTFV